MFWMDRPWFTHPMERPTLDDRELLKQLENRLRWDQRVSLVDVQLQTHCGYVTLSGVVDAAFRRLAALELVSHTEGVQGYQDRIIVDEGFVKSDGELVAIVTKQLGLLSLSPEERIFADVARGVVRLRGQVSQVRSKALAAGLIWSLSGVRDCINLVEVVEGASDGSDRLGPARQSD